VFFVIQTVFIATDWLLFPESFLAFLPVRLGLDAIFGLIYFSTSRSHPLASAYATCFSGGAMLLFVTYGSGGGASGYYVGLIVLFTVLGTLLPINRRQASFVIATLYAGYIAIPFIRSEPVPWSQFGLHLFFLGAAGFAGVISCSVLDRMRFSDFRQRRDLERAANELRDLDQAKSRFTANIHHELRTPLTLMLAPLDAIRSGDFGEVPETVESALRTMNSNGQRLLKLINNLLDLAKIESQQLSIQRTPVDLAQLAAELVEGARPTAQRKGIELELEGFREMPVVCVDPDAFEKIVVNLVGNSLKFTEWGEIVVSGGVCEEGIHITVSDTGIGIPPAQLGKVFDRFAQVDASATRKHEGTGIGLSLVSELVQLHGGRVWAESEGEGSGTEMHVILPIGEADAEEDEVILRPSDGRALTAAGSFEAMASEVSLELDEAGDGRFTEIERSVERWEGTRTVSTGEAADPGHPPGTPEVVIAEDNAEMRRLLAFLIGREFQVRVAGNGRMALEAVQESLPELVVTDVMMPEMSGTDLCRVLKEDPETRGIPVMLVTSKAEREMKIEGLELGADDYVTKPFHPRELLARVRSLVRLRQLQQEIAAQNASLEASNADLERALSDLKEAEVQLVQAERLAAVGELSAGVAHEVNNPLNFARNSLATLRTYVNDLRNVAQRVAELDTSSPSKLSTQLEDLERDKAELGFDELADARSELVGIVNEGLDRTTHLVSDLREFAAPHRGENLPIDVRAGLRSTVHLLGHRLREAGAELTLAIDEGVPTVVGDAGALNQVFLNILKNAAEAIEGEGGLIHVTASGEEAQVVVRIRDTGSGIEAAVQERLFEPFYTTKVAGKGTGLGLSMSRRIVERHGGSIEIESEPGEGTCVTVRLPAEGANGA
jgi:signal transduction histidine kinase